jgi:serine O-acetyltransferase
MQPTMNEEERSAQALAPHAPTTHAAARDARPDSDVTLGQFNQNPPGLSLMALLREDLQTHDGDWVSQGFWAIAVHRFGNWRMGIGNKYLRLPFTIAYKFLYKFVEWTCGISLNYTVRVGRRVHIWHHGGMILGAREIGNDVHIRQNTTFGVARRGDPRWMKPIIQDRADIGTGAVNDGGIVIGHDSVVGANAVVTKDVPPNHIAVGIPAANKAKKSASAAASLENTTEKAEVSGASRL